MARVIQDQGPDAIEKNIGVDATSACASTSIVAVELAQKTTAGRGELQSARQPWRYHHDEHGAGRDGRRRGRRSWARITTSRAAI